MLHAIFRVVNLARHCTCGKLRIHGRAVAQPGSASVSGSEGRKFKSCQPDQFLNPAVYEIHIVVAFHLELFGDALI